MATIIAVFALTVIRMLIPFGLILLIGQFYQRRSAALRS